MRQAVAPVFVCVCVCLTLCVAASLRLFLVFLCSYLVDSLPADAFRVRGGVLHTGTVATTLFPDQLEPGTALLPVQPSPSEDGQRGVTLGTQLPKRFLDDLQALQVWRGMPVAPLPHHTHAHIPLSECAHQ
jgi:hypothetical protein